MTDKELLAAISNMLDEKLDKRLKSELKEFCLSSDNTKQSNFMNDVRINALEFDIKIIKRILNSKI